MERELQKTKKAFRIMEMKSTTGIHYRLIKMPEL